MVGPMAAIFVVAALHWPGMLQPVTFAGLGNVRTVLDDPVFWEAVRNTAVQLAVALPVMIGCAYMLGYYVAQRPPGHRVVRYLLFVPGLISTPAKAMVFYAALSPDGLANGALKAVGLGSLTDAWLASPSTALGALIALDLWSGIGFTAVLFAARLSSVPDEVGEAAQLDGAGHWRTMWRVHFPVDPRLRGRRDHAPVPVDPLRLRPARPAAHPGRARSLVHDALLPRLPEGVHRGRPRLQPDRGGVPLPDRARGAPAIRRSFRQTY